MGRRTRLTSAVAARAETAPGPAPAPAGGDWASDRPARGWRALRLALGLLAVLATLGLAGPASAAEFVVTKTADTNDGVCNADCSLREAINAARGDNTATPASPHRITFNIAGSGVQTISPATPLPVINRPVVVDGTTMLDANGQPRVRLDGAAAGSAANGLQIITDAPGGGVRGLIITRFGQVGISVSGIVGSSTTPSVIEGNFIGTDPAGTAGLGNGTGVLVHTASFVRVGGTTTAARNVISGNGGDGIRIVAGAGNHSIQGNYVGVNAGGTAALANAQTGVAISGAPSNVVGGTAPEARNVISGNGSGGVLISGIGATGNRVEGNYIGTDATGTADLGNGGVGVTISNAPDNTIGGAAAGARNVIAGNGIHGVSINGSGATGNRVEGNHIGTDASGTAALANAQNGVSISDAPDTTIGGTAAGAGNVISGNRNVGVLISGSGAARNKVEGNHIGTKANGAEALPNGTGIRIDNAGSNVIGGTAAGARNVIAGNGGQGVRIGGSGATGNRVEGNYIGTNAGGAAALANAQDGVSITGAPSNVIGGAAAGARNVIAGNGIHGVSISGSGAAGNRVEGNHIGTNAGGAAALANAQDGVRISEAPANTIGGTAAGARNVISGNGTFGVLIIGVGASGNKVEGNHIGTDAGGAADLGNGGDGVRIVDAPANTVGGAAAGARNVISGNGSGGVSISGSGATGNRVEGNHIGTDAGGAADLGNAGTGVVIAGADNTVGGTAAGARNVIAGNDFHGVLISGVGAARNKVEGNHIGTDASGTAALANAQDGVRITGAPDTTVGGTAAGSGNTIAFNGRAGVAITSASGNRVLGNAIFDNGGLGIDLGSDGLTANDAGDADTGPNNRQNFPILTAVGRRGGNTIVGGRLDSTASSEFRLEFFASPSCDSPSGHGEGRTFIGTADVTTGGGGSAPFAATLAPVSVGQVVTATATREAAGGALTDTSEFSACRTVELVGITVTPTGGLATTEAGGTASFSVVLDTVPTADVTIALSSSDTTEGTVSPASLTFTPADARTPKTVTVTGVDDAVFDGAVAYTIVTAAATSADPAYSGLNPPDVEATNADNEPVPTLSIGDASVTEGNAGTIDATFTIGLSVASAQAITVQYATGDGTATAGGDYTAASGTLTFAPGETSKTIAVPIVGDGAVEADETFFVTLGSATTATVADALGVGTIVNDDVAPPSAPPVTPPSAPPVTPPASPPPLPRLTIEDLSTIEGHRGRPLATFTVLLSAASSRPVTVRFATANLPGPSGARAGIDFVGRAGTLTIPAGKLFGTIAVQLLGDTRVEPDKRFRVNLSAPSGATLARAAGVGTIVDDDGPQPRLVVGDARRAEGQAGRANLVFPVLLTRPSPTGVTATVNTADETARAGSDYAPVRRGRLAIAAGATRGTVVVPVVGDRAAEPHERLKVVVSRPSGAAVADGLGIGTILSDD